MVKLSPNDLRAMKVPVLALAVACAVSFAMVVFTSNQKARADKEFRDQQKALDEASKRFQRSGEERETVMHYLQAYRQLEKIGFIGSEQRLTWVESLRTANASAGLFGVEYRITAQEPYPFISKENPMGEQVRQSRMGLTFGVLHEGDLGRLFQALAAQQPGMFTLNGCSLDRAGRQGPPVPKQANLTAECELSWLTVEPKGDKS